MSDTLLELLSLEHGSTQLSQELDFVQNEIVHIIETFAPHVKNDFLRLRDLVLGRSDGALPAINEMIEDDSHINDLVKTFSLYMMMVNIIEEREEQRHSLADLEQTVMKLQDDGFDREDVIETLRTIELHPVFTAHPTESKRRTFLEAHRDISLDLDTIFKTQSQEALEHLRYRLNLLWQTDPLREEKIEVMFELDNLLYIIENSVLKALHHLNCRLTKLTGALQTPIVNLGSWIGGDRDGNPFVTNEIMTQVMKTQATLILNLYITEINKLIRELALSTNQMSVSDALIKSIEKEKGYISAQSAKMHKTEPFRSKLSLMKQKLQNKLLSLHTQEQPDFFYKTPQELIDDIDLMIASLHPTSAQGLIRFRNLVLTAGFHLLKLDFREHKETVVGAVSEIFSHLGLCDSDFVTFPDTKKQEIFTQAFAMPKLHLPSLSTQLSPQSQKIVEAFLKIKWAQEKISPSIIESVITSMTTDASDLLAVLWLAMQAGLWSDDDASISITPLFETIDDLEAAPQIIRQLYRHPVYKRYLQDRHLTQEIMIGYSDSSKDGGIFASNFNLNRAIINLTDLATDLGLTIRFFHGRGGSVSRGGGPTKAAILATPAQGVGGFLKITEQGEVISSKYLNPAIAEYNFLESLGAVLEKSVYDRFNLRTDCGKNDSFVSLMRQISDVSMEKYRDLVYHTPGFVNYFKEATPFRFIELLNIGSRPSKRKETSSIEDLRAIPWVFAWTQNRSIIPAWYGVGTGLEHIINEAGLEVIQESFATCPFFNTTLDNIAMGIMKSDLGIAQLYNQFVSDQESANLIWSKIVDEHAKVIKYLTLIRNEEHLLEHNNLLRQSILLRKPYLSALNIFQVELMKKYTQAKYEKQRIKLQKQIASTIVAISLGIRNTG